MKKLNLMTPINPLGYGVAGTNILRSLNKSLEVCLFPIGQPEVTTERDGALVSEAIYNKGSSDPDSPCVKIWHEFAMHERVGRGKLFAFPFFEITKFGVVVGSLICAALYLLWEQHRHVPVIIRQIRVPVPVPVPVPAPRSWQA